MQIEQIETDVVVVGCGIAGLCAAVTAVEAGARVVVLERSDREERGGNSRWTEANLRMKSVEDVADDLEEHLAENAGHHLLPEVIQATTQAYQDWPSHVKAHAFTDPELITTLADGSPDALQWLENVGVKFSEMPGYFLTTSTSRIVPIGGGLAIIDALAEYFECKGGQIMYQTTAKDLTRDACGRINGILATTDAGPLRVTAKSTILASGGFQGNPEMLARYVGPQARYTRPVARGGYYDRGEGIVMGLTAGAAAGGDFTRFHAEPIDPRSDEPEPIVLVFNYGIMVNRDARRFTNEAPGSVDATYEAISRQIFEQPDGIAYAILDSSIDDVPNWKRSVRTDQPPVQAKTIAELASKLDLDVATLEETVAAYNRSCTGTTFDPLQPDGLATDISLQPAKSNWARPIEKGPFLAYPIICGNCFTFGGLKVSKEARVVDGDGRPVPGLFGAGEVMGFYHGVYTGASSVLRSIVFGRIAGHSATGGP